MPSLEPSPVRANLCSDLAYNDIARRAYELYCERGCQDGRDVDDWLQAERELRSISSSSAA